jgi:hypothetical protein
MPCPTPQHVHGRAGGVAPRARRQPGPGSPGRLQGGWDQGAARPGRRRSWWSRYPAALVPRRTTAERWGRDGGSAARASASPGRPGLAGWPGQGEEWGGPGSGAGRGSRTRRTAPAPAPRLPPHRACPRTAPAPAPRLPSHRASRPRLRERIRAPPHPAKRLSALPRTASAQRMPLVRPWVTAQTSRPRCCPAAVALLP